MAMIETDGLTPMQRGRLDKALDARVRIDGVVTTWRAFVATVTGEKQITDDSASYSRTRFNRMGYAEQAAYMARLASKRCYHLAKADPQYGTVWIQVPKIIYDAVQREEQGDDDAGPWCTQADLDHLFGVA